MRAVIAGMRVQFRRGSVRLLEARGRASPTVFAQRRRAPSLVPRRPSDGRRHLLQLQPRPRRWFLSALRRVRERRRVRRALQRSRRAAAVAPSAFRTNPSRSVFVETPSTARRTSTPPVITTPPVTTTPPPRDPTSRGARFSSSLCNSATVVTARSPRARLARASRVASARPVESPRFLASRRAPRRASTRAPTGDDETTIERRRRARGRERRRERGQTRARDDDDRRESDRRRRRAWRRARATRRDATDDDDARSRIARATTTTARRARRARGRARTTRRRRV